ncbi:hypothetical protein HGRIS_003219 [Hohenbuehelia grisea]|uniref:DUF5648 domain-containing protein n=1 Tax=Hohenbuehelia grisea TaxID=104357 RepID=A0ABR3JNP9_9AGAR
MKFSFAFVAAIVLAQAAAFPVDSVDVDAAPLDARAPPPGRDCPPRERAIALLEARLGDRDRPTGHFYTTDEQRMQRAEKRGYTRSRQAPGRAYATPERGTRALFHFRDQAGNSHYTADPRKREQWLNRGYKERSVAAYLIESDRCNGLPFTRFVKRETKDTFFGTTERDIGWAKSHGYTDRGVEGYVLPI